MKVIFIKDQPGGGKKGQLKEVSDGYAMNFLIPKGFAQVATTQIISRLEKEAREADAKKNKEKEQAQKLKNEIAKRTFKVAVKVGDRGQVFGGIHEKDVALVISEKMGLNFDKNQVELPVVIKDLGEYIVKLKLSGGILAEAKIKVEPVS